MLKSAFQAEKMHGLIYDGAMFLGNIAFLGFVPRIGDDVAETTGGTLLLLAVITQIAGAWWKKGFLGQRLAFRKLPPSNGFAKGFMNVLLFLHFILFSVITLFSLALLGVYEVEGSESVFRGNIWVIIAFLVGGITTNLVRTAGHPNKVKAKVEIRLPGWLEFGADGLLWVSVSLVTRIFWDGLMALIEPASGSGMGWEGIVLLAAVLILYVFFYLPGRYLFLVEDCQSGLTWVQVFIAMLPVVWTVIIG